MLDMSKQRVKIKPAECPVKSLFIQWLGEWRQEAKDKESKLQYTYGKAMAAMKRYPLPLQNGKDASIVQCCGPKICSMLDQKLAEYVREFGDPRDNNQEVVLDAVQAANMDQNKKNAKGTKKPKSIDPGSPQRPSQSLASSSSQNAGSQSATRPYIPAYRSGAYALLIALYTHQIDESAYSPELSKSDLIELAQPLCDASFTKPPPGQEYYTAWSSMSQLEKKGLVSRRSSPPLFSLAPEGIELALKLVNAKQPSPVSLNTDKNVNHTVQKKQRGEKSNENAADTPKKHATNSFDPELSIIEHLSPAKSAERQISTTSTSSSPGLSKTLKFPSQSSASSSSSQAAVDIFEDDDFCFDASPPEKRKCIYTSTDRASTSSEVFDVSTPVDTGSNLSVGSNIKDSHSHLFPTPAASSQAVQEGPFKSGYMYLTDNGVQTPSKGHAKVDIDESLSGGVGFLARVKWEELAGLPSAHYKYCFDVAMDDDRFVGVFIADQIAAEITPGYVAENLGPPPPHVYDVIEDDEGLPEITKVGSSQNLVADKITSVSASKRTAIRDKPKSDMTSNSPSSIEKLPSTSGLSSSNPISAGPTASGVSLSYAFPPVRIRRQNSQQQNTEPQVPSNSGSTTSTGTNFELLPDQFDIILCVDFGETAGAHKAKKQLETALQKNQVPFEQKKLSVGDFVWIARKKQPPGPRIARPGALKPDEELVLDFVVERKRMDDLASSIMDGRFREQKHRLKSCGLRRPIYLVEQFGPADNHTLSADALNTAIVNTQIQDGFLVVRTDSAEDSVAYLTLMTANLIKTFAWKTLERRNPDEKLEKFDPGSSTMRLLSFAAFQQAGSKTGPTTVRQIFTRQLMQFKGISCDKALAITARYPTMRTLVEAYRGAGLNEKEAINLIAKIRPQGMSTCIGQSIGKILMKFYMTDGPFDL